MSGPMVRSHSVNINPHFCSDDMTKHTVTFDELMKEINRFRQKLHTFVWDMVQIGYLKLTT